MFKKFVRILFVLALIILGTIITVADHLFIGIVIFIAMIVMVASGPKPLDADEESDMALARKSPTAIKADQKAASHEE